MTAGTKQGDWRRRGSSAAKRPPGKKGEGYIQVNCIRSCGKSKDCPLCEGTGKIWVVP